MGEKRSNTPPLRNNVQSYQGKGSVSRSQLTKEFYALESILCMNACLVYSSWGAFWALKCYVQLQQRCRSPKVCQLCCRSLFFLGTKTSLGHFKVKKSCKGCSGLFLTACVSDATRQAGCRKGCQLRSASDMLLCQHLFGCWRPAASARTSTHWKYPSCQYCNGNLFGVEWKRDDVTRACRRLPADSRLLWKVRFCSRLQGSRRVM